MLPGGRWYWKPDPPLGVRVSWFLSLSAARAVTPLRLPTRGRPLRTRRVRLAISLFLTGPSRALEYDSYGVKQAIHGRPAIGAPGQPDRSQRPGFLFSTQAFRAAERVRRHYLTLAIRVTPLVLVRITVLTFRHFCAHSPSVDLIQSAMIVGPSR
jgi:hypothetical protein